MHAPTWFEPALFGCAVVWFGLADPGEVAGFQARRLPGLHHALTAGAMIWMITAMSTASRMGPAGVEAGGLMAGAFVALREKLGQLPGLATSWP